MAANALPEIFVKVAEAKRMMQTGEADTVGAATKQAGISRSAFYKYKDAVQPFNDMKAEHIITFYCMLKDNTGVLSSVLSVFATSGANILTINQSIPTNGCAAVTISAETSGHGGDLWRQLIGRRIQPWKAWSDLKSWPGKAERKDGSDMITNCNYGPWHGGHRRCQGGGGQRGPDPPAKLGEPLQREDDSGADISRTRPVPPADDG